MNNVVLWCKRIVLVSILFGGTFSIIEALWWNNARSSYPRILLNSAPSNTNDLDSLRKICGEPLEVARDGADFAIARCGLFWPMRSVWHVPKSVVAPTLR